MIEQSFFGDRSTTLDLNGPFLSFTTQPVGITTGTNSAVFTGIATATFLTPATNTGYIAYQWYEVGVGALADSSRVTGSGTTTLTVSQLISPTDNGRQFFLKADYIASAYNTTGVTTVGTARSTGNAVNDTLDSNIVTLSLTPTLYITSQPSSQTAPGNVNANFSVDATASDGSNSAIAYNWLLNGNQLTDSPGRILNSNTKNLTLSLPARVDAQVTHTISSNVTTAFNVVNTGNATATVVPRNIGGAVNNGLAPGSTLNNDNRRYYDVTFSSDLGTTNYDVVFTNIATVTAGRTPDTSIGVGYISKRTNGFKVWFYRSGDYVCAQPSECLLYVWPPNGGTPTDTSVSGSKSTPFTGLSIDLANPSNWVQQTSIATGINYSGSFVFTGFMNNFSPDKRIQFRLRAVLPNGTTVTTGDTVDTGSASGYSSNFRVGLDVSGLTTLENLSIVVDARFPDNTFQSGINVTSSTVTWSGTNRTYQGQVYTIDTHVAGFNFSLLNSNTVQAKVSHPTANNSPIYSNVVNYNIINTRAILNLELLPGAGGSATLSNWDLGSQGAFTVSSSQIPTGSTMCFYSPEKDINVYIDMAANAGANNGGYTGGQGGKSTIALTLKRNEEYMINSISQSNNGSAIFIYHKASLIACIGGGGNAGNSGNGGDGGGINVSGGNGTGPGAGSGGTLYSAGTLPGNGIFGSTAAGVSLKPGDGQASSPNGGRTLPCPKGDYWYNLGYSACQDLGNVQFYTQSAGVISNSTNTILRGFKAGYGIRQTAGAGLSGGGAGGNGATGGNGGNGGGGGGGGSGYTDGSVTVVSTQQGGNTGLGYVTIRVQ